MVKIRLIKPSYNLEYEFLDMITEWKKSEEELIPWSLNLYDIDFNLMVEKLNGYSKGIGLPEGFIENSTYWLINENDKILGAIDIRHKLTDYLLFRGGHIGYGIRPSERQKGYASLMLSLAMKECKDIGLSKVLITCLKSNLGSAKTILNNGGILESEDIDNGEIFQRYWIYIK
ncbi:GNAT family N-acetyltransferase [Sedimentibacter sp. MB31-C6]|uniref:GNAT family N-acetyltransferase n=1 Tax=Sedimentibacter sp. MB31-C6 TaxID=3109366 RepID=UPI002DDC9D0E|nr:GNAT family N-acetyltransferase [Sedimentibacter sp. MB36-C1]WSI04670.1 GNAT family N-acetyltransferase [Sedimentibacter sp. MB36-C1]